MWSWKLIAADERDRSGIQLNIIDNRAMGLRAVRDEKYISPKTLIPTKPQPVFQLAYPRFSHGGFCTVAPSSKLCAAVHSRRIAGRPRRGALVAATKGDCICRRDHPGSIGRSRSALPFPRRSLQCWG